MAIHAIQGLMGAGKSYVAVNRWLREELESSTRHIYTNLPLARVDESDPESDYWIVRELYKKLPNRRAAMARIHKLISKERIPTDELGNPLTYQPLDEEGEIIEDALPVVLGLKHGVKEFWYFTQPNSVVFLDEVADIWPTEERKNRPDSMKSYIRHHRHYKDDLFFMFQDKEDIDPDLRRKIQKLFICENSTKRNMFDNWMFRGLKWPIQFFMVRGYLGRAAVGLAEDSMKRLTCEDSFWVFPKRIGYRNYHSFSQAGTLQGKRAATQAALSSDFNPSLWPKVKDFVRNIGPLAGVCGLVLGLAFGGFIGIRAMLQAGKQTSYMGGTNGVSSVGSNTVSVAVVPSVSAGTNSVGSTNVVDLGEKLVFANAAYVKTTKRTYAKGDKIGDETIASVMLNGVAFESGTKRTFAVLFPRR